jgi:hypothetical protein
MSGLRRRTLAGLVLATSLWVGIVGLAIPQAWAAGDDALQILKAMSDYLASQKTISANFDSTLEAVTPQSEKIQFTS